VPSRYEYDRAEYVWPGVVELRRDSTGVVAPELLSIMEAFLVGFSGICNFNYKLRCALNIYIYIYIYIALSLCIYIYIYIYIYVCVCVCV